MYGRKWKYGRPTLNPIFMIYVHRTYTFLRT